MWKPSSRKTTVVLALLALCAFTVLTPSPARDEAKADGGQELADLLERLIKFEGVDDPKMTFGEAVDQLNSRFGLHLEVNTRAFEQEWETLRKKGEEVNYDREVLNTKIVETPIPEMPKVRLATVLKTILGGLPSPSGATFLIRRNAIEVTTMAAVRKELGRENDERVLPLTYMRFEKEPLESVLKKLSDQTDVTVLIDVRVADKAKLPVSASLKNVPLDTAVRLLADMADLEPTLLDNALYVTTRVNAARLTRKEKDKGEELLISK